MSRRLARIVPVILSSLLLACGGDDPASPPAGTVVGPAGGTVTGGGGRVELVFPAGAVADDLEVSITAATSPPADAGVILARAYEFSPDGATFLQPVTLTIGYDQAQVPAGVDEADLALCKKVGGNWQRVAGSSVDVDANEVSAAVSGFSSYAPGDPAGGGEASIVLSPATITMPVYGTQTFTATVEGLDDPSLTWTIVEGLPGGRLRGGGVYCAPSGGGVFHVRATSTAEPGVYGEAEVTVATAWECPEEPPEPPYELVWAREIPPLFTQYIYGIAWYQGQLWVGGQAHLEHWSDQGEHLGWTGRGVDGVWPFEYTYTGYHEGTQEDDRPQPWDGDGEFDDVYGVACDDFGNIYACDYGNERIVKLNAGGLYLAKWTVESPLHVAVSPHGFIYVENHVPAAPDELLKYSTSGGLLDTETALDDGAELSTFGLMGCDAGGEIFLSFPYDHRVVARLDPEHAYLGSSVRYGDGACEAEWAVTVDDDGNIFVADTGSRTFKKFDRDGWLLAAWPFSGPGYQDPRTVGCMTLDDQGNVYVTDPTNGMILKFRPGESDRSP